MLGRDSSVGIATRHEPNGPGMESRWGARFSALIQTSSGSHIASCTMGTGSFPELKRPGRDVDHPPHQAQRLKKEQNYTSAPHLGRRGLFHGELYLVPFRKLQCYDQIYVV